MGSPKTSQCLVLVRSCTTRRIVNVRCGASTESAVDAPQMSTTDGAANELVRCGGRLAPGPCGTRVRRCKPGAVCAVWRAHRQGDSLLNRGREHFGHQQRLASAHVHGVASPGFVAVPCLSCGALPVGNQAAAGCACKPNAGVGKRQSAHAGVMEEQFGQRSAAQAGQRTPRAFQRGRQSDGARTDQRATVAAQDHFTHMDAPARGQAESRCLVATRAARPLKDSLHGQRSEGACDLRAQRARRAQPGGQCARAGEAGAPEGHGGRVAKPGIVAFVLLAPATAGCLTACVGPLDSRAPQSVPDFTPWPMRRSTRK